MMAALTMVTMTAALHSGVNELAEAYRLRALDGYLRVDDCRRRGVFEKKDDRRIARRVDGEAEAGSIGERLGNQRRGNNLLELHLIDEGAIQMNAHLSGSERGFVETQFQYGWCLAAG